MQTFIKVCKVRTMKRFTKTEVTRKFSDVSRAAIIEPVVITENGKDRHVVMSFEHYEKILEGLHGSKMTSREGTENTDA